MPKYVNDAYDIEKAFKAIEDELIASMIRNMSDHRKWEDDEGFRWSQWQVDQLKSLEKYKQDNKKKFTSRFSDINNQIDAIIKIARQEGGMDQEIAILNAIKQGHLSKKTAKSVNLSGEFFRMNDRKMDALIKATKNDFERAEQAMLRHADDQYRKIIFNAEVYANSGAGTYQKAVDMATKDFLSRGITCIEYKNGARHTMADYASMCIRTASKRAYLTGEGEKRQEWGEHLVILNKRGNACPLCLPFVGKILIDDVWSGGSEEDGPYKLMSAAIEAGLYHPNCKDGHTTYFPEIEEIDTEYSKKELNQITEDYRQDQQLKYAERQVEKFNRLAKHSLDPDNKMKYENRVSVWEKECEEQKNKSIHKDTIINKQYIDSLEYKKLFQSITNNDHVNDVIYKCSKKMLKHRSGTMYEDMYFIDMNTGQVVASSTDMNIKSAVGYNKEIKQALRNYDMSQIIAIHNHPSGMPPSAGDFNSILKNGYWKGFTIGHDGSIIEYTKGNELINILGYEQRLALERNRNDEYHAQIATLNALSDRVGIKYKEIAHGQRKKISS